MKVVRLEHVFKDYMLGDQVVQAANDISVSIESGAFAAISGPSGSGKTTMLNMIGCIDHPTSGKVYINDQDVTTLSVNELADLRARTVGFIFQTFNLLPVLSAYENVEFPLLYRQDVTPQKRTERASKFIKLVGLEKYAHHRPNQLSGGQRQRVAIARALAVKPTLVLADEPTANLDKATGNEILQLMKALNQELGTTFIFSTHDQRVIDYADRLIKMEDGHIRALGMRPDVTKEWTMVKVGEAASATAQSGE